MCISSVLLTLFDINITPQITVKPTKTKPRTKFIVPESGALILKKKKPAAMAKTNAKSANKVSFIKLSLRLYEKPNSYFKENSIYQKPQSIV